LVKTNFLIDELLATVPNKQEKLLSDVDRVKYQTLIEKKQQLSDQLYAIMKADGDI
jgi:hypothetical protein